MILDSSLLPGEGGHADNWKRVAGAGWFTPTGESSAISLGDVVLHKFAPEVTVKRTLRATREGFLVPRREAITGFAPIYELELAEFTRETLELLYAGESAEDVRQFSGTQTITATAAPRRWLDLGFANVSAVTVQIGDVIKDVDFDYLVDPGAGKIYVREGGTIAAGAPLSITFTSPAARWISITPQTLPERTGDLQVVEYDGRNSQPLSILRMPCSLRASDFPTMSTEDPSGFTFTAVATGRPSVWHRTADAPDYVVTPGSELVITPDGEPVLARPLLS